MQLCTTTLVTEEAAACDSCERECRQVDRPLIKCAEIVWWSKHANYKTCVWGRRAHTGCCTRNYRDRVHMQIYSAPTFSCDLRSLFLSFGHNLPQSDIESTHTRFAVPSPPQMFAWPKPILSVFTENLQADYSMHNAHVNSNSQLFVS
jgi:hypothetical protein